MSLLSGLDMRTPAGEGSRRAGAWSPGHPSLEHRRNPARSLQQRVRAGDPEAVAAVREFHPRLIADTITAGWWPRPCRGSVGAAPSRAGPARCP